MEEAEQTRELRQRQDAHDDVLLGRPDLHTERTEAVASESHDFRASELSQQEHSTLLARVQPDWRISGPVSVTRSLQPLEALPRYAAMPSMSDVPDDFDNHGERIPIPVPMAATKPVLESVPMPPWPSPVQRAGHSRASSRRTGKQDHFGHHVAIQQSDTISPSKARTGIYSDKPTASQLRTVTDTFDNLEAPKRDTPDLSPPRNVRRDDDLELTPEVEDSTWNLGLVTEYGCYGHGPHGRHFCQHLCEEPRLSQSRGHASEIVVQSGHNVMLLTLLTMLFLPLSFVTSLYGMTNMDTDHSNWTFGLVTALVGLLSLTFIGSLSTSPTTRGSESWKAKLKSAIQGLVPLDGRLISPVLASKPRTADRGDATENFLTSLPSSATEAVGYGRVTANSSSVTPTRTDSAPSQEHNTRKRPSPSDEERSTGSNQTPAPQLKRGRKKQEPQDDEERLPCICYKHDCLAREQDPSHLVDDSDIETFKYISDLVKHLGTKKHRIFMCSHCYKIFDTSSQLRVHIGGRINTERCVKACLDPKCSRYCAPDSSQQPSHCEGGLCHLTKWDRFWAVYDSKYCQSYGDASNEASEAAGDRAFTPSNESNVTDHSDQPIMPSIPEITAEFSHDAHADLVDPGLRRMSGEGMHVMSGYNTCHDQSESTCASCKATNGTFQPVDTPPPIESNEFQSSGGLLDTATYQWPGFDALAVHRALDAISRLERQQQRDEGNHRRVLTALEFTYEELLKTGSSATQPGSFLRTALDSCDVGHVIERLHDRHNRREGKFPVTAPQDTNVDFGFVDFDH